MVEMSLVDGFEISLTEGFGISLLEGLLIDEVILVGYCNIG